MHTRDQLRAWVTMHKHKKNLRENAIRLTGDAALTTDLPLWVKTLGGEWVLADASARDRALRMEPHARWIYGVK